ncbi:MAG: hypothetical protein WCY05_07610, partial [Candidatus Omnitrophota bacterium]
LKNITYGEVIKLSDEKLIMKLREWGSLRGQPYFRTLNGKFHYVPVLQLLAKMNHPEWGKEKVAEEVNKKYQIVWGTYLRTFENANNQDFKDKFGQISYILKKYFDEYGYFVELTDLAKYDENLKFGKGRNYNILQRYNPATGKIDDIIRVDLGTYYPFANEGKPGNQAHNRRFMRGEVLMNLDMNQDFYIEQAFSLPMLVNMFSENNGYYKNDEGKNVALVGYPEDIYTQDFSLSGKFHAVADRTFVGIVQRTLQTLGARFHYGHPDAWRASVVDAFGGVSRSYPVNEDIYGAYQMMLVGKKVLNIEFLEAGKGREVSWGGTDGIFRKFGMGATQQMYGRIVHELMQSKNFDWTRRLAHIYGGIGYYLRKPIVKWGIFTYLTFMVLLGVSGFAPFTNEILYAMLGVIIFAQAITATGLMQMIVDKPFVRGVAEFLLTFILMSPFFMAHVFTMAAGASLAMAGVAFYVATGRGHGLNHTKIMDLFKGFAKSHIVPGFIATAIAVAGILLWWNPTMIWSAPYVLIVFFAMYVPIVINKGALPIFEVSLKDYRKFIIADFKDGVKGIKDLWKAGWKEGAYDKVADAIVYSIAFVAWNLSTFLPFTLSVLLFARAGAFSLQSFGVGAVVGIAGVIIVPILLNLGWNIFSRLWYGDPFKVKLDKNVSMVAEKVQDQNKLQSNPVAGTYGQAASAVSEIPAKVSLAYTGFNSKLNSVWLRSKQLIRAPPSTTLKVNNAIIDAWSKVRSLGSLDEIRKMSLREFAKELGVKWFSHKDAKLPFYLSVNGARKLRLAREGKFVVSKENEKVLSIKDISEINEPGIYANLEFFLDGIDGKTSKISGNNNYYANKAWFFHELLEETFAKQRINHPLSSHVHPRANEQELLFAALLGEEELAQLTRYFEGSLKEYEKDSNKAAREQADYKLIKTILAAVKSDKGETLKARALTYWNNSDKSSKNRLSELESEFSLTTKGIRSIISSFQNEMKLGLSGKDGVERQESSLAMLPTFVDNPTGKEKGKFLALDLGGSNFRVLMVDLK